MYDSQEEYEEEEKLSQSPSLATKKQQHVELEKDIDEISMESDEYDPKGKHRISWMR